jgi:hypothetical protein
MQTTNCDFENVSLKPFLTTSAIFCAITALYLFSPKWLPIATVNLAKDYVKECQGLIKYKSLIGLIFMLSGFIGFMVTEKMAHKNKNISLILRCAINTLQLSGGVYIGWGLGLLLYVILTGKNSELPIILISLSYLLLLTACPIQFAEQMIRYKSRNNRLYKDAFSIPRVLFMLITLLGALMSFGVIFWGW